MTDETIGPIVMRFDPFDCGCEDTAAVFRDDIARTLYLLWRRNHIVSQYFAQSVMEIADRIRKTAPQTPKVLENQFGRSYDFTPGDVHSFCEEYFGFFDGSRRVEYRVELENKPAAATE